MKLISLKCPSCGACFEANSEMKKFTCNYCGVTTVLDDEKINVNVIHSQMQNDILNFEELIENGNVKDVFNMCKILKKKYPNNAKINKYNKRYGNIFFYYHPDYVKSLSDKELDKLCESKLIESIIGIVFLFSSMIVILLPVVLDHYFINLKYYIIISKVLILCSITIFGYTLISKK